MPIFRKLVTEKSTAVFAIKADTKEEADKAFDDFFDHDKTYDEYREHMNCNMSEEIDDLHTFDNEEAYNRYAPSKMHDFYIEAPEKQKEPLYTLYISFTQPNAIVVTKAWTNLTIDKLADVIKEHSNNYILTKAITDPERLMFCMKNDQTAITYTAERRK